MFQSIKSRLSLKKVAVVAVFALVLTGSGLSSLASLQDTLNDSVAFNTLSVNLQDGTNDSSSVTFSGIDPSVSASFEQDIDLNNAGTASATVSINTTVLTGAGSDLDNAITSAVFDGSCAASGTRLSVGTGAWTNIVGINGSPTFAMNGGQHRPICIRWAFAASPNLTVTALTAKYQFVATHP